MLADDIFICFDNEKIHEEHLRKALEILMKNKLYVKFSKCDFWIKKVLFIGYIISKNGVAIDPSKVVLVMDWNKQQNVIEIRSFWDL